MINASQPIIIHIIEKRSNLCKGIAYGTPSPAHLLNVRAGRMEALAGHSGHFYSWLDAQVNLWHPIHPTFQSLQINSESYLPRKLYAAYLQDLFYQVQTLALQKGIMCHVQYDEAQEANLLADGLIEVVLKSKSFLLVDYLVLATGVPSHRALSFEKPSLLKQPAYIRDIWDSNVESYLQDQFMGDKGKGKKIVIIGSGLTAVDVLFTLHSMHYQGVFHFISRHGRFPEVHSVKLLPLLPDFKASELPNQILDLIQFFKSQLKKGLQDHLDWRQIIDAFRHCTQALWQSFSLPTKQQFMRHVFFLWNKHRHRMSPQSFELVKFYQTKNALTLTAGIVQEVGPLPNGKLQVKSFSKDRHLLKMEETDCVINCSGHDYRIIHHPDLLIQHLLKKQIVLPDDMGLGLKLIQKEMVAGKGEGKIYALGALLFGELFETIAVPEIREQAHSIAKTILSHL